MRRCNDRRNKNRRKGSRGIITVFVTLMMVPVVTITGMMVDVTRLKMYSSQSVMAADSFGEAVLSEYDNVLKELYGLFAVTQSDEGLAAIETLNKYIGYSFNPNGDSKGLSGFMPYKSADMELSYEKVDGFENNNVLMTQIGDFMKFRIIQQLGEDMGLLDALDQVQSYEKDMDAIEARTKITNSGAEALEDIQEYYQQLKKIKQYKDYIDGRKAAYEAYSGALKNIVNSDEYKDYRNYLEKKDEIDAAREKYDRIQAAGSGGGEAGGGDDEDAPESETMSAEEEELRQQYVDVDAYLNSIKGDIAAKESAAKDHAGNPINFDNTSDIINGLGTTADKLDAVFNKLNQQITELEGKLEGCSEEVKEDMEQELKDLKELMEGTHNFQDFKDTYHLIADSGSGNYDDKTKNASNKEKLGELLEDLDEVRDAILEGSQTAVNWTQSFSYEWGDFMTQKEEFYKILEAQCKVETSEAEGDKAAGDKEIDHANDAKKRAEEDLKRMEEEETTTARNMEPLAEELKTNETAPENQVPGLLDSVSGGLSFQALGDGITVILDKFLVASYDFGMFSSRVTGIKPPEENTEGGADGGSGGDAGEEYADYSLTKVKMCKDINYLYGAELEYLFGGHNKSKDNLNEVRNIICGVRMTMNFISTYKISEINEAIRAISDAAMEAVAASVVGAPFAPLVKVAVSGALRMAFATIETVKDWQFLMERKDVKFFKTKIADLSNIDAIKDLLGDKAPAKTGTGSDGLALTYENYLYVLLSLFVDHNTLLQRTSNLITVNVNQAMLATGEELSSLKFKMEDTVTAVKTTCKVKMDFVVIPDNFVEMFLNGTDTKTKIEVLEDQYFGYTVIRGY